MGFKHIIAKKPNMRAYEQSLMDGMKQAGSPSLKSFFKITGTWDHQPKFTITVTKKSNVIEMFVGVVSNWSKGKDATAEDIFMFNTRGTSKRYGVMSPNFSPKTRKGLVGSMSGSGGLLFVNPNKTMPGIKGREHEQTVAKKQTPQIKKDMQAVMVTAAKKANWTL